MKKIISIVLAAALTFFVLGVTAFADFVSEGGKTYYETDGERQKGFEKIDGDWYYFKQADGAMAKSWLKINGNWYYFSTKDGKMLAGKTYKIGGETYTFASDGKLKSYKAEGFLKGTWGDSDAELSEKIGESFSVRTNDEEIGGGIDDDLNWIKISNTTSVASEATYVTLYDKFVMAQEQFLAAAPTAEVNALEPSERYGSSVKLLTEEQIKTVYKLKMNEAERKCGKARTSGNILYEAAETMYPSDTYTELKAFLSDDLIIYVAYNSYEVVYCEISLDILAEAYGSSKSEIIERIIK
jgi:hypothetical protein